MKTISIFIFSYLATLLLFGQGTIPQKEGKPFVLGTIREIESKVLSEKRVLNIYLPAGYNVNDPVKYPVIYLLDGSADEDFIHIAGLIQFANFPWVNLLPNSILVGIANVDRKRDFTFPTTIDKDKKDFPSAGKSAAFINFIELELQPFVDKNYKTTNSRTIIGQSLGGLLATEILLKKPQLFNNYIIVSPSLWWNNESLLKAPPVVLQPGFTDSISIFIAVGNEGKVMESDTKGLAAILKKGLKKNSKIYFEYFPLENHSSILHTAVYKAFEIMNKAPKQKI